MKFFFFFFFFFSNNFQNFFHTFINKTLLLLLLSGIPLNVFILYKLKGLTTDEAEISKSIRKHCKDLEVKKMIFQI